MADLIMHAALYLHMLDGETQEQAEDRLLELCDSVGVSLIGWSDSQVEHYDEEGEQDGADN